MEIKEVIEKYKRDYKVEQKAIQEMANVTKNYIGKKCINKVLEDNGFNGFYVLPDQIYKDVTDNLMTAGYYNSIEKVVILDGEEYFKEQSIAVHELCHAYLDDKNVKSIEIDGTEIYLGRGIEEGAASILQSISTLNDINNVKPYCYKLQSRLFQQLNVLYKYSKIKDAPNLLIYLLKYPEQFLPLIRDVYYEILERNCGNFDKFVADRSAHHLITVADILTEHKNIDKNIYYLVHFLNSLYLTIADKDIYNGKKEHPLFCIPKDYLFKTEFQLLLDLFKLDIHTNQLSDLDLLLKQIGITIEEETEEYYQNNKIKFLRR